MAQLRSSRSVPLVLATAIILAGCSSTRIDPLELDYYSKDVDPMMASYKSTPPPVRPETAPIVPIGGGVDDVGSIVSASSVTVRKGDSLYGISARHLGSGKRWPEIARLNGLTDADVTRLAVGRELKLPPR